MGERYIGDLPDDTKKKVAAVLDVYDPPNWRSLINVIRHNVPSCSNAFIDKWSAKVGMEGLLPGGSPTLKLLSDLENLGRGSATTVGELVNWINSMGGNTSRVQTIVNILTGAPVIKQNIPEEVQAALGQDVRVHCEASGKPPLYFQWFKKRNELQGQVTNTLSLQNVSPDDEGFYVCRVANSLGVVFTGWTKVTIDRHPSAYNYRQFDFPIITCQSEPTIRVAFGSRLRLYCDGVGVPAPSFQWYKNNAPVEGATFRELTKLSVTSEDQGNYFCKVYNSAGEVSSDLIQVIVAPAVVPRGFHERVANKVALLIGNMDYQHGHQLGQLFHPINDVCGLMGSLLNMNGFKVLTLVNLTLKEMREALRQFCRLLVEDTFALFYFAGHGFERGGLSYLMPVDATDSYRSSENMASSEVLVAMQETNAKLHVVLLDCCRTEPDNVPNNRLLLQGGDLQAIKKPNVVLTFGCCSQSYVYESRDEKNGFFAKHLLKNLTDEHKNKSIEEVLLGVSRGIDEENLVDPSTHQKQIVNRITTLVKPMSLWCPVDSSFMNPATVAATNQWQSAHEIPTEPVMVFQDDNNRVKVVLNFNAEVSNVLIVNARALGDAEKDCSVTFDMCGVVSGCKVERNSIVGKKCRPFEATLKVKDLQRLKEPLVLKLTVMYTVRDERKQISVTYKMEEKPLYAKLVTRW